MKIINNKTIDIVFGKKCFVYYKIGKSKKLRCAIMFEDQILDLCNTLMRRYGVVYVVDIQNKPMKYDNINIKGI